MNDKKKMILLIALAVLVLGIGAFQFVNSSGGDKPQPKPEAKKEPAAESEATETETDPALQYVVLDAAARDPFQEGVLPLGEGQTPPPRDPPRTSMGGSRPGKGGFVIPDSVGGSFLPNPLKPNVPDGIGIQHIQAFDVIGAIVGEHPAAVFVDENGRQRLVTVGGSFGDDRHLVSVDGDRVTVRHKDKTITYTVGGTPNAK